MSSQFIILAFEFGNALMLGWLAAASIPLLIHLWNKRKHQEMPWAAMEYLLAAMRNNSRRIRIEEWLLLAVRTLLIVLVVLAVAELYLASVGRSLLPGQRTHKVLVIDASFSMAYKPGEKSRFERAKELAADMVQQSNQGDGFTLLLLASPPRVVVRQPTFDRKSMLDEIAGLRLIHARADLPATLEEVEKVLTASRRTDPQLTRQEIFFLTDLGRNTWAPDFAGATAAARFRQRTDRLKQSGSLVVIDLGQPQAENMAVTALDAAERFITTSRTVNLLATVHNFGAQAHRQTLQLIVDGQRIQQSEVMVEPRRDETARFSYRFETPGNHQLEARLAGDALDIDNHRWLSLPVKPFVSVLCVDGKPRGPNSSGATHYLMAALEPDARGGSSNIRAQSVPESALAETDLSRFDCVILSNVAQFSAGEARQLDAYLKKGGGLIFFLGDRVLADRYNQELAGETRGCVRVLPARVVAVSSESQYTFDPLDYRHRLLDAFRGNERSGLTRSPIFKYVRLKVPEGSRAETALAFRETGDPAIVEERIHAGRSIVVATAASLDRDNPWSVWPTSGSFLEMVQELTAEAVSRNADGRNVEVGSPLASAVPAAAVGTALTLNLPDGRREPIRPLADGDAGAWTFADTLTSGIYHLHGDSTGLADEAFAVNVDTVESDLTKLDPADLPSDFTARTDWQDLGAASTSELQPRAGAYRGLLYGVLGLLLLETLLAWQMGRGR